MGLKVPLLRGIIKDSQIHVVWDGVEALKYLFGTADRDNICLNHCPQLLVLDLKLPKIDGFEVLKKIKSHPEAKKIPVIVLTGSKDINDWVESYDLGVDCLLQKTSDFDKFVEAADLAILGAFEIEREKKKNKVDEEKEIKGLLRKEFENIDNSDVMMLCPPFPPYNYSLKKKVIKNER